DRGDVARHPGRARTAPLSAPRGQVAEELKQRLERRDATIGVIGLGYVGLPLAVAFAKAGLPVIGVDADAGRPARLRAGVTPGNRRFGLTNIPKVVGGVTASCMALASALYGLIIERVVPVSSPQAAELVKLFENIFRSVNIALVNELAIMCRRLGLSVWEIID